MQHHLHASHCVRGCARGSDGWDNGIQAGGQLVVEVDQEDITGIDTEGWREFAIGRDIAEALTTGSVDVAFQVQGDFEEAVAAMQINGEGDGGAAASFCRSWVEMAPRPARFWASNGETRDMASVVITRSRTLLTRGNARPLEVHRLMMCVSGTGALFLRGAAKDAK